VSPTDAGVVVLGLALLVGELWYFLGPRSSGARPKRGPVVQEIRVRVRDGYDPATIFVEAGRPVRLLFYRDETAECSDRVIFEDFGIDQPLPAFQTTAVEFQPTAAGDYHFHCGKSVLRGRVVAQVGRDGARQNLGKGHLKHG
jgi:plastocyanin domain-containing protein